MSRRSRRRSRRPASASTPEHGGVDRTGDASPPDPAPAASGIPDRAGVLAAAAGPVALALGLLTALLVIAGRAFATGAGWTQHVGSWTVGILLVAGGPITLAVRLLAGAGSAHLLRGRVTRLVQLGAALGGVVLLQWIHGAPLPGAPTGIRRWVLALGAGLLAATLIELLVRPMALRRLTADARHHRHGVGRGRRLLGLVVTVLAVAGSVTAGLGVIGAVAERGPSDPVVDQRPTRRVILIGLEGVTRRQLAYWVALNERATLSVFALNGATAYFEWDPTVPERAWRRFLSLENGEHAPAGPSDPAFAAGPPGLVSLARAAYPTLVPPPGGTGSGRPPLLWEVAAAGDLATDLVGWPQSLTPTDLPGARVVPAGAHAALRALIDGDDAEVRGGRWGDPALLTSLRPLASRPWEDWRSGATVSAATAEVLDLAGSLGVDEAGFWEDRFRLGVLERWLADDPGGALLAVHLGFPRWVAEAADSENPDVQDLGDALQVAVLDHLEERMEGIQRGLRAGDALVVLAIPPPPDGGAAATGTAILFGEKVAPGLSRPEAVPTPDLARGVAYLLGLRLPADGAGRVPEELLVEGVTGTFVPAEAPSWRPFGVRGN